MWIELVIFKFWFDILFSDHLSQTQYMQLILSAILLRAMISCLIVVCNREGVKCDDEKLTAESEEG